LDHVFANAGISETEDFLADTLEGPKSKAETVTNGAVLERLKEPAYPLIDVNLKVVLNVIKLAHYSFKRDATPGSIVITSSATAYSPEQSLPVYSALKLALVGLVRSLRHNLFLDNITVNAVVPASTETRLIAPEFIEPIKQMGLPVSSARYVGTALVYSAVPQEMRKVEVYGKEPFENLNKEGRWNGRVIFTLGDTYTELEEKLADLRPEWFGKQNLMLQNKQQAITDFRQSSLRLGASKLIDYTIIDIEMMIS
jgi:NAD(P)-dependent dehydrogenase (short-subunit alcohol dehydrogenase family)